LRANNGTEMLAPVYEALFEKTSPLDHQIILMTDGAISREKETMALVNQYIGNKRLHVVSIGSAPNSYLIKGLARAGRGSFLYVDTFTFKEKAKELLFKINHPVIKNLELQLSKQHEMLPKKFSDVIANDPISFFLKVPNTKIENLNQPIILTGSQSSNPWKFEIHQADIQIGKHINQLWAREKIDNMMFENSIGFLDTGTYKKIATNLALRHSLVTEFTSLVAVDDQISRENNQSLISYKIAQNIPDGWIEPQIAKLLDLNGHSRNKEFQNLIPIDSLEKVDLNTLPTSLKVNFVQTATDKYLYFFLSALLLLLSLTLFKYSGKEY
jgi:Ca-activated chloride channel family protein